LNQPHRNLFIRCALACVALFVFSSCARLTKGVSPLNTVDLSSSDAKYSISIWTPDGPGNLRPRLSIDFTNGTSNGLVGVGWYLSAVSSIDRCGSAAGEESNTALITLSKTDRFCWFGEILGLRPGSAPYGEPGSFYSWRSSEFPRVSANGVEGDGPKFFEALREDGRKLEFGTTADSRAYPGVPPRVASTPVRWMLSALSDSFGNQVAFAYVNKDGFAFPSIIGWAPNTQGGRDYRYEARINYSSGRIASDSYIGGQIAGYEVSNRHRLESIQVMVDGVVKRKYHFTYDLSAAKSRSRLVSFKECFDDTETTCSAPVAFRY
jgi:hypothetical protein